MTVAAARLWKYIMTSPKWHYPSPQVTACLLSFNNHDGQPRKKKKKNHSPAMERKAMTNLDSVLKSRDITLPTKFHTVKAMVFPVVVYGCES